GTAGRGPARRAGRCRVRPRPGDRRRAGDRGGVRRGAHRRPAVWAPAGPARAARRRDAGTRIVRDSGAIARARVSRSDPRPVHRRGLQPPRRPGRLADRPAAPGRRRLRRGHRPPLVARDSTRRDPLPSTAPAPPDAAGDGLATRVVVTHPARAHRRGTSRRCPRLPPGETGSAQALVTTVNLRDGAKTSHTPSWPAG